MIKPQKLILQQQHFIDFKIGSVLFFLLFNMRVCFNCFLKQWKTCAAPACSVHVTFSSTLIHSVFSFLSFKVRTPPSYGQPMDRQRILRSCLPHVTLTKVWWRGTHPEVRDLPRPQPEKAKKVKKVKKTEVATED